MVDPATASATVVDLPPRRTPIVAAFVALRPRQWTKNLLLFAGIVFAAKLGDAVRWVEAVTAFVAYCAASSAAYLVNDVRDVDSDRLHPVKRARPIARGELSPRTALVLAAGLAIVALSLTAALGAASLACMVAFASLQAAYSLRLKAVELVDVLAIAGLFVLRAAAGAIAVDVPISQWLLLCTFLLALFLALAKRRAELGLDGVRARATLEGYTPALVDQRHAGLVHGDDQPVAIAEVVLRRGVVALAGGLADVAQRDAGDAVLGEQPLGRRHDRCSRRFPLGVRAHALKISQST